MALIIVSPGSSTNLFYLLSLLINLDAMVALDLSNRAQLTGNEANFVEDFHSVAYLSLSMSPMK